MLNLHDRDWKEFYIKDIFFINPGKRLTKTNMIDGNKPFIGANLHIQIRFRHCFFSH